MKESIIMPNKQNYVKVFIFECLFGKQTMGPLYTKL